MPWAEQGTDIDETALAGFGDETSAGSLTLSIIGPQVGHESAQLREFHGHGMVFEYTLSEVSEADDGLFGALSLTHTLPSLPI